MGGGVAGAIAFSKLSCERGLTDKQKIGGNCHAKDCGGLNIPKVLVPTLPNGTDVGWVAEHQHDNSERRGEALNKGIAPENVWGEPVPPQVGHTASA